MKRLIVILFLLFSLSFVSFSQESFIYIGEDGEIEWFTADELSEMIFPGIENNIKQMNRQCPIVLDEYTELTSALVIGTTIHYNYTCYIDIDLLDEEDIKEFCEEKQKVQEENSLFLFKQNNDKMPINEWIRLYKELGIKYNHNFKDINGKIWAKIVIDFKNL